MPKERGESSMSSERAWPLFSSPTPTEKEIQEWDDAKCPICIEPPHNAILLICSSHRNGCRPFICNTDSRLSNCYHQFRGTSRPTQFETGESYQPAVIRTGSSVIDLAWGARSGVTADVVSHEEGDISQLQLQCPLCRGQVLKWTIVQSARNYMNTKRRSCSSETCDFVGAYEELVMHAMDEHPDVRPRAVDPERVQRWMVLEHERVMAEIRSSAGHVHFAGEDGIYIDGGMQIGVPVSFDEDATELNRLILEQERDLRRLLAMRDSYYRRADHVRGQDLMPYIFNGRRMPPPDRGTRPVLSVEPTRNPFVEGSGRIRHDVRTGYYGTGLSRRQSMPGPHIMHPHMSFPPPAGREIQLPRPREGEYNVYTGNIPRALRSQQIYRHAGNGNVLRERGGSSSSIGSFGARSENRPEPANGPVSSWSNDMLATAQNDVWTSIDFGNAAPRNPSQTVMGYPPMSMDFGNYDDDYNGYDDYEYEEEDDEYDDYDVEVD